MTSLAPNTPSALSAASAGTASADRRTARTALEFATLEWVDWFNYRRVLEPIGNIPPADAEERYYAMLDEPAMAA